jgi:hypothetical protein
MVEDLVIKVDGDIIPRDTIRDTIQVTLHGNTYTLGEMETNYQDRWEFGEKGVVTIQKTGGLAEGEHMIAVTPHLRISYLPFILTGEDTKTLALP